jgi:hypothetical protein
VTRNRLARLTELSEQLVEKGTATRVVGGYLVRVHDQLADRITATLYTQGELVKQTLEIARVDSTDQLVQRGEQD